MERRFKFSDRAAEKDRNRAEDEARLGRGKVSAGDLRRENSFFRDGFSAGKIGFSRKYPSDTGKKYMIVKKGGGIAPD